MDTQGFRSRLQSIKLSEDQIDASLAMAERFEAFLAAGRAPSAEAAREFSRLLVAEGSSIEVNYLALARYCRFIKNKEMFVAFVEFLDGAEVSQNLYRLVAERFGPQIRDELFSGIGVAPPGTSNTEKPAYLQPVIARLQARVGEAAAREFLSPSLRDLPDEYYLTEREIYRQAGDIDAYLVQRKANFVAELEACQREGRLFFTQEITPEVLDFVRSDPEIGGGRREGRLIYETKIPYLTHQYLTETDPTLKRYYGCHCPWAREAIQNGSIELAPVFCYCSAGYHKKPFEVIFEQPLKAEVLESILQGDDRCRFAIELPDEVLP